MDPDSDFSGHKTLPGEILPTDKTVMADGRSRPQAQLPVGPFRVGRFTAMRQIGVAEERGSGWDKIAFELEFHQLPPARVEVHDAQTQVTIYAPKALAQMDKPERILAVYQHACLRWVSNLPTNNASVRVRLGISDRNKAQASRIIKEAVDDGAIVPYDPTVGPRSLRYVPSWAAPER